MLKVVYIKSAALKQTFTTSVCIKKARKQTLARFLIHDLGDKSTQYTW